MRKKKKGIYDGKYTRRKTTKVKSRRYKNMDDKSKEKLESGEFL